jgi:hypothetical protein
VGCSKTEELKEKLPLSSNNVHHFLEDNNKLMSSVMNIKVVKRMRCFNCYSEFLPTISKPICKKCCFCHYCRDFSCFHHDLESPTKVYNEKGKA